MRRDCTVEAERILWIDAARGATIALVVLLHATLALIALYPDARTDMALTGIVRTADYLDLARMPAFFLCAGLVFSFKIDRGWDWFLRHRAWLFLWLILVWTAISAVAEAWGLHLYPRGATPFVPPEQLLLVPYGVLWFLYALPLLSAFALVVRRLPLVLQCLAVLASCTLIGPFVRDPALPMGLHLLVEGLAEDGLVFFMLGLWWGSQGLRLLDNRALALLAQIVLPVVGLGFLSVVSHEGLLGVLLVQLPTAIGFLATIRLLAHSGRVAQVLAVIGQQSLVIFLMHPFLVAIVFGVLQSSGVGLPTVGAMVALWLLPIGGSLLAVRARKFPVTGLLFRAPALPVGPGALLPKGPMERLLPDGHPLWHLVIKAAAGGR